MKKSEIEEARMKMMKREGREKKQKKSSSMNMKEQEMKWIALEARSMYSYHFWIYGNVSMTCRVLCFRVFVAVLASLVKHLDLLHATYSPCVFFHFNFFWLTSHRSQCLEDECFFFCFPLVSLSCSSFFLFFISLFSPSLALSFSLSLIRKFMPSI